MSEDKLIVLDRVERALAAVQNIDEAKGIRDRAEALRRYAKSAKMGLAIQNRAAMVKILSERLAGEFLAKIEREQGKREGASQLRTTLVQSEIPRMTAHRWQTLATVPEAEIRKREAECNVKGEELTSAAVYTSVSRFAREQETSRNLHRKIETVTGLHHGDFRRLSPKLIADESVHLVITDPPYDGKSVQLFSDAAIEAARVLRPGGSMLIYSGQKYLYEVGKALSEHLRYWWTFCVHHQGGRQLLQKLGVRCGWKPVIWMVKGTRGDVSAILDDVVVGGGREKDSHEWQQAQAEAEQLIGMFTAEGETVVDFFAGSCTTAKAAEKLGRKWIGFEIASGD